MDNQVPDSYFHILARERSHEEARQTVAVNRMLIQSLVIVNGGAAITILASYGWRTTPGSGRAAVLLTVILYCLGVFAAIFAGLYVRRTTQEWSSFWEIKANPDMTGQERSVEGHRRQAIKSKRWSTGLLVLSEILFLIASLSLAGSLG
jgi:hypothetical protein